MEGCFSGRGWQVAYHNGWLTDYVLSYPFSSLPCVGNEVLYGLQSDRLLFLAVLPSSRTDSRTPSEVEGLRRGGQWSPRSLLVCITKYSTYSVLCSSTVASIAYLR